MARFTQFSGSNISVTLQKVGSLTTQDTERERQRQGQRQKQRDKERKLCLPSAKILEDFKCKVFMLPDSDGFI